MCMVMHITVVVSHYINGSHFNYSWKIQLQQQFKIISLFHVWSWLIEVSAETEHTISDIKGLARETTWHWYHYFLLSPVATRSTFSHFWVPLTSEESQFPVLPVIFLSCTIAIGPALIQPMNPLSLMMNPHAQAPWSSALRAQMSELNSVYTLVATMGCNILTNQIAVLEVNKSHNNYYTTQHYYSDYRLTVGMHLMGK